MLGWTLPASTKITTSTDDMVRMIDHELARLPLR